MSLRGIFDGGGVRKQNGHWQSSNSGGGTTGFRSPFALVFEYIDDGNGHYTITKNDFYGFTDYIKKGKFRYTETYSAPTITSQQYDWHLAQYMGRVNRINSIFTSQPLLYVGLNKDNLDGKIDIYGKSSASSSTMTRLFPDQYRAPSGSYAPTAFPVINAENDNVFTDLLDNITGICDYGIKWQSSDTTLSYMEGGCKRFGVYSSLVGVEQQWGVNKNTSLNNYNVAPCAVSYDLKSDTLFHKLPFIELLTNIYPVGEYGDLPTTGYERGKISGAGSIVGYPELFPLYGLSCCSLRVGDWNSDQSELININTIGGVYSITVSATPL